MNPTIELFAATPFTSFVIRLQFNPTFRPVILAFIASTLPA
jgi:hypothetical protein